MPGGFLIQMAGHAGAGKTTVAHELAERTGAAVLDLDTIKSALLDAGLDWDHSSRGSYAAIYALVEDLLSIDGAGVIVDSPSYWPEIGARLTDAAARHGARHLFVECVADEAVRARRLRRRPHRRSQVTGPGSNPPDAPPAMDELHRRSIHRPAGTTRIVVRTDGPSELRLVLDAVGFSAVGGLSRQLPGTGIPGFPPRRSSTMDVIDHLTEEHRKVEGLLAELAESDPGRERQELLDDLESSLSTHMAVEERFVYPVVVDVMGEEPEQEAENEHGLARDGLRQMRDLVDEPGFGAAVEMVTAGISHHVHEEEHEVFPALRERASDRVAALGDPEELERRVQDVGGSGGEGGPTKEDLYEQAKDADVEGRSSMTKAELAEALDES
jgi:predicted kinase/hemerythrin-like domain-containing protein